VGAGRLITHFASRIWFTKPYKKKSQENEGGKNSSRDGKLPGMRSAKLGKVIQGAQHGGSVRTAGEIRPKIQHKSLALFGLEFARTLGTLKELKAST